MFGNVNWYFTDILQQKTEITDLKAFLDGENTSVLIILAPTVNLKVNIFLIFSYIFYNT